MDKGEEHLTEDGGPFSVISRGEFRGEESALEPGEGSVPDFAAGIDTLGAEGAEYGRPVSCPGFWDVSNNGRPVATGNMPSFLSR